jgi:hypothetical protein
LTAVVIPASVKKIGDDAFSKCAKLTSVTIQGSGVTLGSTAFVSCTELAELNIPDGDNVLVPNINEYGSTAYSVFGGCKKLPLAMRAKLNAMGFTDI